jgi:hypothetical protein
VGINATFPMVKSRPKIPRATPPRKSLRAARQVKAVRIRDCVLGKVWIRAIGEALVPMRHGDRLLVPKLASGVSRLIIPIK